MANLLKRLQRGVSTSPLWLIGLLLVFSLFLKKKNFSPMEYDLLIQKILTGNGYSPEMSRMFAAVSRHETGNYSSAVLSKYKNLFGMKDPVRRPTTNAEKDLSDYAEYNSAADSVRDLVLYLDYVGYPLHFDSAGSLVTFMKSKGYFEAPLSEYINGVERALPKVARL